MKVVSGLFYSEDHEWLKVEEGYGYVGITDFAQHSLGDVVFVELPEVGEMFSQGDSFGAIESVKAASDMLFPVSGKVVEVNTALEDDPSLVNVDPYDNWIIKIELSDEGEKEALMDASAYEAFCKA